jgi:hypothetical protein
MNARKRYPGLSERDSERLPALLASAREDLGLPPGHDLIVVQRGHYLEIHDMTRSIDTLVRKVRRS